jgi:hypothetical protein
LYARKLESEMPAAGVSALASDGLWPRYRRVAFLAVAASLCWALPIAVAYLIATV